MNFRPLDFRTRLLAAERVNDSLLCVGLDPEPARFPGEWKDDPARIFDFCSAIVDATKDLVLAFKPQIAYFAAQRAEDQLERLMAHIRQVAPAVPVILDAKRGDIGSTAEQYAREAFVRYAADAVTLSPYLGFDALEPWLRYDGRGLILLCRTSNPGGADLQAQTVAATPATDGQAGAPSEHLYERIARLAAGAWNRSGRLGLVVGATYPDEIARVRALAPTLPLLIPGIGAQGGDAAATVRAGWRGGSAAIAQGVGAGTAVGGQFGSTTGPIIVSSSRAVLYASAGADFAQAARNVALATRATLNLAR